MAVKKTVSSERDWWLGLWDWASMVETNTGGRVQVSVKPDASRGFWVCEVRLCQRHPDGSWDIVARRESHYPTAQATTVGAHLMNEVIKLDKEIEASGEALLRDLA